MKKLEKEMQETEAVESQQKRAKLVGVKFAYLPRTVFSSIVVNISRSWLST